MFTQVKSLSNRRSIWFGSMLVVLILVAAACGPATPAPTAAPTTAISPTVAVASTDTPDQGSSVTPSVTVFDQPIVDGKVTVAQVVSDGPGWIVIHAQADAAPGPILGFGPVADGENSDVAVEVDVAAATETLYAMLHTDAGQIGTWEFPGGPDAPVQVDGQVVTPSFAVTGGLAAAVRPSVSVSDQAIVDSKVTVAQVVSDGPGWIVIHAQADAAPGPILGFGPVAGGENPDVAVEVDVAAATETLYAMLHTDAGQIGTWEFPGGPDAPVQVDGQVVTPSFAVTGGLAAAVTPSVSVSNQPIVDGKVTVAQVVSDGPGWIVIHAQADGAPGPILGFGPVAGGQNSDVAVEVDVTAATETLYAMLHTDAGQIGTWEFPGGPDAPVQVQGQVITPAFGLQVLSDEAEVEIEDFQFQPKTLVVRVGTTVKWSNKDQAQHTATSDTNVWDSGYLAKGEDFFFTFTQPGVYPYYCIPHGAPGGVGMAGTIIVLP